MTSTSPVSIPITNGVILDLASIDTGDLSLTTLMNTGLQWTTYSHTAPDVIAERIANAQVVVTNKVPFNRAVLTAAPQLKLICIAATGTNNVDLAAARELGIAVTNVPGYATPAVVQHVFAGILAFATQLWSQNQSVTRGDWCRSDSFCLLDGRIYELAGRCIGIVGYGALGRSVAQVAEAFGMRVLIAARTGEIIPPGRLALTALLPQVDILTLHCPLTPTTRWLIGTHELKLMRPTALLINTARGGIVDECALATALQEHWIGGALIDVLTEEPPPLTHPLLAPDIPNLIVTPHAAWSSHEARQRLLNAVADNITAFINGTSVNRVV
ncbi:D-2-hydroxyacid dehydrogenase [Thiospirillum jenense]|uniref:D-2-hydroxyacid dehydrogenase n=2 Tax=Thiospirillum jenense TaxID=1653858 RepID=A0A839HFK0_9GAMM|nr:D-2-hydroxyacid dehydrogenase [Thiospirillum jenense]